MARLVRCPLCESERYYLYSRAGGKIYTKQGNKVMETTGHIYCAVCKIIFNKDGTIIRKDLKPVRDELKKMVSEHFNGIKLAQVNQINSAVDAPVMLLEIDFIKKLEINTIRMIDELFEKINKKPLSIVA